MRLGVGTGLNRRAPFPRVTTAIQRHHRGWEVAMVEQFAGRVAALRRYPVKSILGELRNQLPITPRGALGDRAWALRETATGRIASAKRFPQLLALRAEYEVEPTFAAPGRIQITLPDGRTICPDDPGASTVISDFLGHSVRLENQPASDEK